MSRPRHDRGYGVDFTTWPLVRRCPPVAHWGPGARIGRSPARPDHGDDENGAIPASRRGSPMPYGDLWTRKREQGPPLEVPKRNLPSPRWDQ